MRLLLPPQQNTRDEGCQGAGCAGQRLNTRRYRTNPYEPLSCRSTFSYHMVNRHDAVCAALYKHLKKIGNAARELPHPGAFGDTRGDVRLYLNGARYTIDVAVVAQCALGNAESGAWRQIDYAARQRWQAKHWKYYRAVHGEDAPAGGRCRDVVPFIIETSGRIYKQTRMWMVKAFRNDHEARRQLERELSFVMAARVGGVLSASASGEAVV